MDDNSFPPTSRLHHASEFDAVFKQADFRVGSPAFLVLARANGREISRLGLVVGKKTASSAVERNRIKRLIRESFRQDCAAVSLDIVVLARPPAKDYPNRALLDTLKELWNKLADKQDR